MVWGWRSGQYDTVLEERTIMVCRLFAASTGIVGASIVTMSLLVLPMMLRYGYSKDLASATVCGGGDLGIFIRPT